MQASLGFVLPFLTLGTQACTSTPVYYFVTIVYPTEKCVLINLNRLAFPGRVIVATDDLQRCGGECWLPLRLLAALWSACCPKRVGETTPRARDDCQITPNGYRISLHNQGIDALSVVFPITLIIVPLLCVPQWDLQSHLCLHLLG